MERQHFYQIPESIARAEHQSSEPDLHLRLRWHLDLRLRHYIHQRIPDDYSSAQILEIAQTLVEDVKKLPPDRREYTLPQQNLSGCITALLAHILFSQRRVYLGRTAQLLQIYFKATDLHDVFQIGWIVISTPSEFLGNFQPRSNWYGSLCDYTHIKFQTSLTDKLRQLAGDNFKRTNLGLLSRCSSSRLEKILISLSEKGTRLAGLLLLHQCFQEAVTAQQFITREPQSGHYDALLARYQELRAATDLAIADRSVAKELLGYLGNIYRNDIQPGETSFDKPLTEETNSTLVDITPDLALHVSPEQREVKELALQLLDRYAQIRPDSATPSSILFLLLYGLKLTQTEAAHELGCHQTTIRYRHDRQIATLAKEFYLSYFNLPPTAQVPIEILANCIKEIKPLYEDYFAELVIDLLTAAIESTKEASIVDTDSQRLCQRFVDRVETIWQFRFKPEGAGLKRVCAFVQRRSIKMSN